MTRGFDAVTVDGSVASSETGWKERGDQVTSVEVSVAQIWPEQFNVDPNNLEHNVKMVGLVACGAWLVALIPLWLRACPFKVNRCGYLWRNCVPGTE